MQGQGLPYVQGKGLPYVQGKGLPYVQGQGLPYVQGQGLPYVVAWVGVNMLTVCAGKAYLAHIKLNKLGGVFNIYLIGGAF